MDDFLNIRFEGQAGLQAKINALIPALDTQHLLAGHRRSAVAADQTSH
jgi:hypothetical protein